MIDRGAPKPSGLAALFAEPRRPVAEAFAEPSRSATFYGRRFQMTPEPIDPAALQRLLDGLRPPLFEGGVPADWTHYAPTRRTDATGELVPFTDTFFQRGLGAAPHVPRLFEYQTPGERRPQFRPGVEPSGLEWMFRRSL